MNKRRVSERMRRLTPTDLARIYDVPPWLIDPNRKKPRFPRLRWALRRIWFL